MKFTLYNFWWVIIWPCIGLALLAIPKNKEILNGEVVERWNWIPAFILAFPYAIWAGFRSNAWGDTHAYRRMFDEAPTTLNNLGEYLSQQTKDKGFFALMAGFKTILGDNDVLFFFIIALIQIICLVYAYRKYSSDFWFSFFLFVCSTDYIAWMHNGMRQFLVVCISFACLPLLLKKRYMLFIAIVLFLSLFHMTALLLIPISFIVQGKAWNRKTILFIILVLLSVIFLDKFTGFLTTAMENSQYSAETVDLLSDTGTNIFRVLFYSMPAIIALIFKNRINRENNPVVNLAVNMSIATAGFYVISYFTSGVYIGRIPIFFSLYNYILYPAMIDIVFEKKSGQLIKVMLLFIYFIFFYYQMHLTWGMI